MQSPTLYLVAYDISSPRRLSQVARCLEDYGDRMQKSVFHIHLNADQAATLWSKLNTLINRAEDRLVLLPLCRRCYHRMLHAGDCPEVEEKRILVF